VLLRARAIENQVFVAAPAQIFKHPPGNACFGSAMTIDPWGTVLGRAPERVCTVVTEIDFDYVDEVRGKIPVHQHRRPDVYAKG
jgi:deaminated glutathione amidase